MRLLSLATAPRVLFATMVAASLWAPTAVGQDTPAGTQGEAPVKAVLELFTSQGCSSCPAADALLHDYVKRKDVIALSLPVDYWDYLGWKDTLARPKFSARQRSYAKERGDGRVYTPQVVVSGRTHVIGSSKDAIEDAIRATESELARSRVPLSVRLEPKRIVIETGAAAPGAEVREATIWLVMVHREVQVAIERGENQGRTITYYNVVRDFTPIGMWSGKPGTLHIPRVAVAEPGNEVCVVLVQVGKTGPIVAAAAVGGI